MASSHCLGVNMGGSAALGASLEAPLGCSARTTTERRATAREPATRAAGRAGDRGLHDERHLQLTFRWEQRSITKVAG